MGIRCLWNHVKCVNLEEFGRVPKPLIMTYVSAYISPSLILSLSLSLSRSLVLLSNLPSLFFSYVIRPGFLLHQWKVGLSGRGPVARAKIRGWQMWFAGEWSTPSPPLPLSLSLASWNIPLHSDSAASQQETGTGMLASGIVLRQNWGVRGWGPGQFESKHTHSHPLCPLTEPMVPTYSVSSRCQSKRSREVKVLLDDHGPLMRL